MLNRILAFSTAALFITGAAFAGVPGDKNKSKTAKVTEVHVCPETGEAVKGEPAGSEVVGKYKVYFCCAGCKPSFDKLSKEDKEKKVADLVKKNGAKKKG